MNDKELADKIVAFGVGDSYEFPVRGWMYGLDGLHGLDDEQMYPSTFVHDWRVAGAMMEKCVGKPLCLEVMLDQKCIGEADYRCWIATSYDDSLIGRSRDKSLPRAINEACVGSIDTKRENS